MLKKLEDIGFLRAEHGRASPANRKRDDILKFEGRQMLCNLVELLHVFQMVELKESDLVNPSRDLADVEKIQKGIES